MKYLALSVVVLLPVIGISIWLVSRSSARDAGEPGSRASRAADVKNHWFAVALAAVVLVMLTAIFDSIMIGADLFYYAEELISGLRIGLAPIEDFAYPIAGVVLLPALWWILTSDTGGESSRAGSAESRGGDVAKHTQRFPVLRELFWASRPISWINTAYPFGAAYVLATGRVDWIFVLGVVYYLIPYNLALYGINDVFDYASDLRNPRKGGIEGALLAPAVHRITLGAALVTNLPFLVVFVYATGGAGWPTLIALAVSTFALLAYSVPNLRFKERPVLDSVTSSAHFVTPAVVGFSLAGADFTSARVLILAAFFLWGMAAHAFGAVQDVVPDREANLGSVATVFSARVTVRISLALWVGAGILMLFTPFPGPLAALIVVPYLVNCAPYVRITDAEAHLSNRAWRRFIWLNYFCGFLVTLLLIFAARPG